MTEQLRLFDGFEPEPVGGIPVRVEIIDYAEAEFTLGREFPPPFEIDFQKLPTIPELQRAFADSKPISLTDLKGGQWYFRAFCDLAYNGWLDDTAIQPPNFVFYEGAILDRSLGEDFNFDQVFRATETHFDSERDNRWVLLVEPGGNIDGTDTYNFGWQGDPLTLA
jgi:hypothetical protein